MENLFDQGTPSTEFHWIITDDSVLAQDFITKNNLPRSLSEDEFKTRIVPREIPREEMETNDAYAIRKCKIFRELMFNYCRWSNESVTVVSICSKDELGLGASFYRPKDYPEAFSFLTKSVWAIFSDGTTINIRGR